jgi:uncharacterized MAPEG superfamily protein
MIEYASSLLLLSLLVLMVVLQSLIATVAHRKQQQYIPGVVDANLDHHSFVFRSHRTFMNSLENVPMFVLTSLLAMAVQLSATVLFWTSLIYLLARLLHMVLFYAIATNKNPSPRSYFYAIAMFTQLYLIGALVAAQVG